MHPQWDGFAKREKHWKFQSSSRAFQPRIPHGDDRSRRRYANARTVGRRPQGDKARPRLRFRNLLTSRDAAIEGSDDDPAAGMLRHREGVDLMPSNIELAAMEMAVFMAMSRERMMGAWLAPIKADYDYVIVDCAPTLGIIPINALAAADSVLIPVSAEYLPASGMTGLLKTVARVRRQINPGLSVEGILVTLYDSRNNLARDVERTVRGQYGKAYRVFETVVPRAVSAAEAAAAGESVFAYDPDGKVAASFSRLAEEVRRG